MATALRFSSAALRPAVKSGMTPARAIALNGLRNRNYSSGKTQVSSVSIERLGGRADFPLHQSLKETFAEKLPGEIEKIKKLRKSVQQGPNSFQQYFFFGLAVADLLFFKEVTGQVLWARSLLIKSTVELVVSSRWFGKALSSTQKRVFVSEGKPFQNAKNCCPKFREEKSHYQKVWLLTHIPSGALC